MEKEGRKEAINVAAGRGQGSGLEVTAASSIITELSRTLQKKFTIIITDTAIKLK